MVAPAIGAALIGGVFSALGARKQNRINQRNADSVHQREVKDLRKAGLNPILSANGGSPVPQQTNIADQAINTGLKGSLQNKQKALLSAQTNKEKELERSAKWNAENLKMAYAGNSAAATIYNSSAGSTIKLMQMLAPVTGTAAAMSLALKKLLFRKGSKGSQGMPGFTSSKSGKTTGPQPKYNNPKPHKPPKGLFK